MNVREGLVKFLEIITNKLGIILDEDEMLIDPKEIIFNISSKFNEQQKVLNLIFELIKNDFDTEEYNIDLTEFISKVKKIETINFEIDKKYITRKRLFSYVDTIGAYIPTEAFIEPSKFYLIFKEDINSNLLTRALFDLLLYFVKENQIDKIHQFVDDLLEKNQNKGFLIYFNKKEVESIKLYTYFYFKYLLSGNYVPLESELLYKYETRPAHMTLIENINFDVDIHQYFDLLDVINEYQFSSDILSRYLKLYHLFEYLIYRVDLVSIKNKSDRYKALISSLIKLSTRYANHEKDYFINNFCKRLFSEEKYLLLIFVNSIILSNNILIKELKENYDVYFTENDEDDDTLKKFSKLVYNIRNSIVHNKESELHLNLSNIEPLIVIKDLLISLIEFFEGMTFKKIIEVNSIITYTNNCLKLY